jgi:hypothetical protein
LIGAYNSTPATLQSYLTITSGYFRAVARSLGVPFMLLCVAGLAASIRKDRRVLGLALLGVLMWMAIVLPVRFVQARFTLITSTLFAFVAAYGAGVGLASPRPWVRKLVGILFIAGAVWAGLNAADLTQQMLNDGRYALVEQTQAFMRPGDRLATPSLYGFWSFPRFDDSLIFEILPRQGLILKELPQSDLPEFILFITTHINSNEEGDEFLDRALYEKLVKGEMGYRVVVDHRSPAWFALPMFFSVNPRVIVLMRDDLAGR